MSTISLKATSSTHLKHPEGAWEGLRHSTPGLLCVVHCDLRWAVLDKPAGLRTVTGPGSGGHDAIESRLAVAFPAATGPRITHRLDMETSGLLAVAFSRPAHRSLMRQFEHRRVGKDYAAILQGEVLGDIGVIELPLAKDPDHHVRQRVDAAGRASRTLWRVVDRGVGASGPWSRVEFRPETGRRHQLRVHAATPVEAGGLGCPILGDSLYGDPSAAPRLLLHAQKLAFWAPGTGNWGKFASPVPFGPPLA